MIRDYLEFMTSDLLMQFRGENCKNNRILLSALAKQLDDLYEMFEQLEERTFLRRLNESETGDFLNYGAHGIQLDRIGEVVELTRKQATIVSNKIKSVTDIGESEEILDNTLMNFIKENFAMYYPGESLSDSEFSDYLYYKIFLNNSYCEYSDVIKSLEMFWNQAPIYYKEDPLKPATIFLSTPELKPEQNARLYFLAPVVKAAGVHLYREATTVDELRVHESHVGGVLFNGVIQSALPYLVIENKYEKMLAAPSRLENIATNIIPYIDMFTSYREGNDLYIAIKGSEYNKYSTLVYPAMFNGEVVSGVVSPYYGEDSLTDENSVESVSLPRTLKVIGGFCYFRKLKTVEIPTSVNRFLDNAFICCESLELVVIHLNAEVTEIASGCFSGCVSLKEITIPETVETIRENAFMGCDNLNKVVFGGTQEQWESINVLAGNECLNKAKIEYLGGIAL